MDQETLLDRAHLDAQTFGDAALARELLDLFRAQCGRLLPGIADAGLARAERADLAHTLKGSALGIGAVRVAARAAETERLLRAAHPEADARTEAQTEAHVRALAEAVRATLAVLDRGD